ncbi:MAG: phage tail tape measure protein [Gaiellaceae bacterium]
MSESLGDAVMALHADAGPLKREMAGAHAFTLAKIRGMATASKAAMAAGIAGAAVAVGVGLLKVGEEFDAAFDEIQIKTGATGKRLERLKDDFREVFRGVPNSASEVGTAIGEVHRRLELTGRPLQERTKQFLTLSRLFGEDLNGVIAASTRLFADWGIGVERQGPALDKLFRLSQATGIQFGTLSQLMVQFGSPLRQLGLDFDFSAAMFAKFEKEGVNIRTLMPGLRMGLKNLSQPTDELKHKLTELGVAGEDPDKALRAIMEAIEEAPSVLEANALAFQVFGARAGPDMAAAVREGRFELGDLMNEVARGKQTIKGTAEETDDWREKLQILRNKGMLAIEKPAEVMFGLMGLLADGAGLAFDAFDKLPGSIKHIAAAMGILALAAKFNPWVRIITGLTVLAGLIKQNWPEIRKALKNALDWIRNAFDDVRDFLGGIWESILGGLRKAADAILGVFSGLLSTLADVVDTLAGVPLIGGIFGDAAGGIQDAADAIDGVRESLRDEDDARKRAERGLESLERTARSRTGRMAGITERSMERVRAALAKGSKRGVDALGREYDRAIGRIRKAMKRGELDTDRGLDIIEGLLIKKLRLFGVKNPKNLITQAFTRSRPQPGEPGLARGGQVKVPGFGTGDTVPLHVGGQLAAMVEPGELIHVLNRRASEQIDRLQALNSTVPRFQTGGLAGMDAEAAALARKVLGQFGGYVSSGIRPGDDGWHGQGKAFDWVGGNWAAAARFVNSIGPKLLEGIYTGAHGGPAVSWDSGSRVSPSFWGGDWGPHATHIHAAVDALIAAAAAAGIKLPRFVGLAPVGSISAQALNNVSRGLEEALNAAVGTSEHAFTDVKATGSGADLMRRISEQRGWNFADWWALDDAETSHGQNLFNPSSTASLRGQFLDFNWGKYGPGSDPRQNPSIAQQIIAMADYITERYGNPSRAWAFHRSHGWYGRGGLIELARMQKGGILGSVDQFVGDYKGTEDSGKRRKLISETAKRLKQSGQLGLDKLSPDGSELGGALAALRDQADIFGDFASNASALTTLDAEGKEIPGLFQGRGESEWLTEQLGVLFSLRNALVTASEALETVRERVRRLVERAKAQLEKVKAAIKDGERERRRLEKERKRIEKLLDKDEDRLERELAKPKDKRDQGLVNQLRKRTKDRRSELKLNAKDLANLTDKQEMRAKLRDALKGPILEAITGRNAALDAGAETVSGELASVQGSGVTVAFLPELPAIGELSGEIFGVQSQLAQLGAEQPELTDSPEPADEGFSISELLDFVQAIRYGVFDSDLVSGLPAFHGGGIVDGPAGTEEVIRRLLPGEGVIDRETMESGIGRRRAEFVITNWREGRGYLREIADDRISERERADRATVRAGVVR